MSKDPTRIGLQAINMSCEEEVETANRCNLKTIGGHFKPTMSDLLE